MGTAKAIADNVEQEQQQGSEFFAICIACRQKVSVADVGNGSVCSNCRYSRLVQDRNICLIEVGLGQSIRVMASGEIDYAMLDALQEIIGIQRKILDKKSPVKE